MGWLNLPPYILFPFLAGAAFLLWVLRKFVEEEHRHGARSRESEKSGMLRISPSSSLPFNEGKPEVRETTGSGRSPEHPKAA